MSGKDLITPEKIKNKIHTIRNTQVMLDKDLAFYYGVKPIRLREQVKRNITRFPKDFMFQLTEQEVDHMVSQNAIPSKQSLGGYLPYVFTEQGVAAISSVLTSERAIEVNIQIMRAFIKMRRFFLSNAQIFQRLDTLELKQLRTDEKIHKVLNALENIPVQPKQGIFFNGQIFDAYRFIADLIRTAEKSIILIDNYIDDTVLTLFSKRKKAVTATILTKKITKQLALDVKKYNEQYPPVKIMKFKDSHDRFIIIDGEAIYHIGASLKDLGRKWFAFSKMDISMVDMIKKLDAMAL